MDRQALKLLGGIAAVGTLFAIMYRRELKKIENRHHRPSLKEDVVGRLKEFELRHTPFTGIYMLDEPNLDIYIITKTGLRHLVKEFKVYAGGLAISKKFGMSRTKVDMVINYEQIQDIETEPRRCIRIA